MSNTEQQIEQEIQDKGLNAPRLTPEHIDATISSVNYFTADDGVVGRSHQNKEVLFNPGVLSTLTFCVIVLKNGFTVTGESACASPENFDAEIGKKIAYDNARNKIWQLEGYLLKEKLYQDSLKPKSQATTICTEERPCTPCYANDGTCEVNEAFMKELTDLSYKYGVTVGVTQESGDTIALFPMLEEDKRLGASYTEVITGSGFIEFG